MSASAGAMTPGILLGTLLTVAGLSIGCFAIFLDIGITFICRYLAVRANTQQPALQASP